MASSRHQENIQNKTSNESKTHEQKLSFPLSVKNYQCLPEKFSLEDIKPILTKGKIASLKKLYDLWCEGIDLEIYGSFVVQCGMVLVGKNPTHATDIDAASSITPLKDCPKLLSQLSAHGFTEKKLRPKPNPWHPPGFYSYEFNDKNANVDFTVRLPAYDNSAPNVLLLSDMTMKFVKGDTATMHLKFDQRQFLLEHYCNYSMYPLVTPHVTERGVIRRTLKQIKNNKTLYDHHELHMYYKRQKIEGFTKDDLVWTQITDLLKHDFKSKVGTKKFISYHNEMCRMIKEHTFCMAEATLFIQNFCEVILENHYQRKHFLNKDTATEATNMAIILQQYFTNHEEQADNFSKITSYLLNFTHKLKYNDPKIHSELLLTLHAAQPQFCYANNINPLNSRLFSPKARVNTSKDKQEHNGLLEVSLKH